MRVCDYIANRLHQLGIRKVYGLVGGSTAGLNDGFISHPDIEFVAFSHKILVATIKRTANDGQQQQDR